MLSRNLKKWGFSTHSEEVHEFVENTLENFINRKVKKVQKGGRIVLPSEYFGVNSGRYSADAAPGSSLSVSEQFIREPLAASDPTGAIVGGGKRFEVSQKAVAESLKKCGGKFSGAEKSALKSEYEKKMTELMNSVARKHKGETHMSVATLKEGLKMEKYRSLRA